MDETETETLTLRTTQNCSIGIDLLGPDPISNKNKSQKNPQIARFANLFIVCFYILKNIPMNALEAKYNTGWFGWIQS